MDNSKKYVFEKLTPTDDGNIEVYESAIDFVFENADVRNVAISGAYGAGKSSMISSYKKKHSDLKFVHISLAHFQNTSDDLNLKYPESVLEGKILNQLIHQIPADKIPQTNFRVKKTADNKAVLCVTVIIVAFVLSVMHILFFDNWTNFVSLLPEGVIQKVLNYSTKRMSLLFSGGLAVFFFFIFWYHIIKTQKNKNIFKKFNIQGNEIEIFEESDDSYFDKYLNEVLYLFENVEADVIVFEDMDGLNDIRYTQIVNTLGFHYTKFKISGIIVSKEPLINSTFPTSNRSH